MSGPLGISIRLLREFDIIEEWPTPRDRALASCPVLGHTWRLNVGEATCNVCGAPNPAAEPKP